MIAKLTVHGRDRAEALGKLRRALCETEVAGTVTNVAFLSALAAHEGFGRGEVDTGLIDRDVAALTEAAPATAEIWAIAAIHALGLTSCAAADAGGDPWHSLTGFRLWGAAKQAVVLTCGDDPATVEVETHGDGSFRVETPLGAVTLVLEGAPDRLRVRSDGHDFHPAVVRHGDRVTVFAGGHAHGFGVLDPLAIADETTGGGDTVIAPMTGLIKLVDASAGAAVSEGDALIVMEAMKMEHTLRAPRDGVIATLSAVAGDQVEEGAVLIALEPTDD
jgi:3-methylcrotonyl-CoA carboxylase alpha subunit